MRADWQPWIALRGVTMSKFKRRGIDCLIYHTKILKNEVSLKIVLCLKVFHFECIVE